MSTRSTVRAIAACGVTGALMLRTEPVPVSAVPAGPDYRDVALAAELETIRLRAHALRLAWAMKGLCKRAELAGVDVSYHRELAAEIEGRLL